MNSRDIYINPTVQVERIKSNDVSEEADVSYLYQLAEALRELSPESKDRHVWDLEEKVRDLEKCDSKRLELANKTEECLKSS